MSDARDVRTKQDAGGDIQSRSSGLALDAPPFVPKGSQEQRPGLKLSSNVDAAPFVPASYSAATQNDSGTARSGEKYVLYTIYMLDKMQAEGGDGKYDDKFCCIRLSFAMFNLILVTNMATCRAAARFQKLASAASAAPFVPSTSSNNISSSNANRLAPMSSDAAPFVPKAGGLPWSLLWVYLVPPSAAGLLTDRCLWAWLPDPFSSPQSKAANGHAARNSSRSDLMLPDGDDLLGMTAHTPGELAQVECHSSTTGCPSRRDGPCPWEIQVHSMVTGDYQSSQLYACLPEAPLRALHTDLSAHWQAFSSRAPWKSTGAGGSDAAGAGIRLETSAPATTLHFGAPTSPPR